MVAFRATLEELQSADLLLHVVDVSNPRCKEQIQSVDRILSDLDLRHIKVLRVLNKIDLVPADDLEYLVRTIGGLPVSAVNRTTLLPLTEKMAEEIEKLSSIA